MGTVCDVSRAVFSAQHDVWSYIPLTFWGIMRECVCVVLHHTREVHLTTFRSSSTHRRGSRRRCMVCLGARRCGGHVHGRARRVVERLEGRFLTREVL